MPPHNPSDYRSKMSDGPPGPIKQNKRKDKEDKAFKRNKEKVSVIHCQGEDTEEAVTEIPQYAAPMLKKPLEPPERDKPRPGEPRPRNLKTTRDPEESIYKTGRDTTPTRVRRIKMNWDRDPRQSNTSYFIIVTQPPGFCPGASTLTVMQEDGKGSFEAEASPGIFAVELQYEEEWIKQVWDVWISQPRPASRIKVGAKGHE